ncbi:MAG: hypothetical protein R3E40_00695 [Rhodocyclaceae bacterium]
MKSLVMASAKLLTGSMRVSADAIENPALADAPGSGVGGAFRRAVVAVAAVIGNLADDRAERALVKTPLQRQAGGADMGLIEKGRDFNRGQLAVKYLDFVDAA